VTHDIRSRNDLGEGKETTEKEVLKDIIKVYSFMLEKHPELAKEFMKYCKPESEEMRN
jgi:hypothetical protein